MPSFAKKVARNTGLLYFRLGITVFVSLYTTRIVLGVLGVSDYGIYSLVCGTIALLGFFNASLSASTQRYLSYAEGKQEEMEKKVIFNVSVVLHFCLSIFLILIFSLAGLFFFSGFLNIPEGREKAAVIIYGSLVVSTILTVMSVPYVAVLNAHENFKYYAVVGIFESILKLIVAFICIITVGDKLVIYGILMSIIPLLLIIVMRFYCHRHYEECFFSPKLFYNKYTARDMTSFAGWNLINSFFTISTLQGVAVLLNYYGGVVVNTAHGIANQLSGQAMSFSNTMLKALNPALVKSYGSGNVDLMLMAAETGNKLSFACFSIFAIPFIIEAPTLISLWLNQVPVWAVLFCRLVFVRQMISQTYVTFGTCINATGDIKTFTIVSSILWMLTMIIGIIMYEMSAPIYTIYLLLICLAFIRGIVFLFFCHKKCGLDVELYIRKSFIPMFMVTSLMMSLFLVDFIYSPTLLRCVLVFVVAFICFPILFYQLVLNKLEKEQMMNVLKAILIKVK